MEKMKDKTEENVMEAVNLADELSIEMDDLKIIRDTLMNLSLQFDEFTYKRRFEDSTMAELFIYEVKAEVRLIDMAFMHLFASMNKNSKELKKHTNELFDELVRKPHED